MIKRFTQRIFVQHTWYTEGVVKVGYMPPCGNIFAWYA